MIMMKKEKAAAENALHLPMELWSEILARVPLENLLGMELVCKGWRDLILWSPSFAQSHSDHQRSRSRPPGFVVDWRVHWTKILNIKFEPRDGTGKGVIIRSADLRMESSNSEGLEEAGRPMRVGPRVLGSCDGLLLLRHSDTRQVALDYCVYNPVTQSYKRLPTASCLKEVSCELAILRDGSLHYKIIAVDSEGVSETRAWCHRVHLFDELHPGQEPEGWKELQDMPRLRGWWRMKETTTTGSKLHVLLTGRCEDFNGNTTTHPHLMLLSIDITKDETFRASDAINSKPSGSSSCPGIGRMSAWDGAFYYFEQSDHEFRLWELKNLDHDLPTWIPVLSVPPAIPTRKFSDIQTRILLVHCTRLTAVLWRRDFYVYDTICKSWGRGNIDGDYEHLYAYRFIPHLNSLFRF